MSFFNLTIHFWVTFHTISVRYLLLFNSLMLPKVYLLKMYLHNDSFCTFFSDSMLQTKLIILYFLAYCTDKLNKNIATKICCLLMHDGTAWLLSLCATSPVKVYYISFPVLFRGIIQSFPVKSSMFPFN